MAYINISRGTAGTMADRFSDLVRMLKEALHRRQVYHTTVRELSALSPRDLADLGIHRAMISQIARDAAYGK